MNAEETEKFNELVKQVYDLAQYNASKEDALDIPEYVAYEVLTLSEWMSPTIEIARQIASKIIQEFSLPVGASFFVKRHFDLPY